MQTAKNLLIATLGALLLTQASFAQTPSYHYVPRPAPLQPFHGTYFQPQGTYAYPHVRPDPNYSPAAISENAKTPQRRKTEASLWRKFNMYRDVVSNLAALTDRLPPSHRLSDSVELATGDRQVAFTQLTELTDVPNEQWDEELAVAEGSLADLRRAIGQLQLMLAEQQAAQKGSAIAHK